MIVPRGTITKNTILTLKIVPRGTFKYSHNLKFYHTSNFFHMEQISIFKKPIKQCFTWNIYKEVLFCLLIFVPRGTNINQKDRVAKKIFYVPRGTNLKYNNQNQ